MSWQAVVAGDLRATVRRPGPWLLLVLFGLLLVGLAAAIAELATPDFQGYLEVVTFAVTLFLPLVGVVLGYRAVVTERERGTLVLLLSLPCSRAALLAGKFLTRVVVLTGAFGTAALAAAALLAAEYPGFDAERFALFVLGSLAYGLVFVAIATGLSAGLRGSRRVIGAALGSYVLAVLLWEQLVTLLVLVVFRFREAALVEPPVWAEFLRFVNPLTLYSFVAAEAFAAGQGPDPRVVGDGWFVDPGVAALFLVGWIALPLLVGYGRFRRTDL